MSANKDVKAEPISKEQLENLVDSMQALKACVESIGELVQKINAHYTAQLIDEELDEICIASDAFEIDEVKYTIH